MKSSVPNLGFIDETSQPPGITGSSANTVLQLVLVQNDELVLVQNDELVLVQNDEQMLQTDDRFRMDKVEERELLESSDIVVWRNRGLRPDYIDITKCSMHYSSDDECESEHEGESESEGDSEVQSEGESESESESGTMLCEWLS